MYPIFLDNFIYINAMLICPNLIVISELIIINIHRISNSSYLTKYDNVFSE